MADKKAPTTPDPHPPGTTPGAEPPAPPTTPEVQPPTPPQGKAEPVEVKYKALGAESQTFHVHGIAYSFKDWYFTTSDPAVIAFLDGNAYAVRA